MQKLRAKVDRRLPVFIASAGSGLVAQLLERAGVDCVNTFSGARLRANGMGTMSMLWPILDSNKQTLDYTQQDILPAMKGDAFVCACINANDPLKDMRSVLEQLKAMGVHSVSNIGPSISYVDKDSNLFRVLSSAGITLQHEIDMLRLARELDMVSVGLAFDEEDSLRLVGEAQPDIFCFHAGTTKGGLKGFDSGETIEQTAERTEARQPEAAGAEERHHPGRPRRRDGDARRRAVHARPHHVRRVLDRLVHRAHPDRAGRLGAGPDLRRAALFEPVAPCPRSSPFSRRSTRKARRPSSFVSS